MLPLSKVLAFTNLSQLKVRNVLKLYEGDAYTSDVSHTTALAIWLSELLGNLPFLDHEQRSLVLETCKPVLQAIATAETPKTVQQICFLDGRYLLCAGSADFVDLQSGNRIPALPEPALETVSYNLATLYNRRLAKIQQ